MTPELKEIIRKAYREGMSQRDIAKRYKTSKTTVQRNVKGARDNCLQVIKGNQKGHTAYAVRYSDYITAETGSHRYPSLRYVLLEGIGWILENWCIKCAA